MKSSVLILHDIRSAHNVGSLFRTSDAFGVSMIYLSALTPLPVDMFDRPNSAIAKTALGAEKTIPWKKYTRLPALITQLKKKGYKVVAVEQSVGDVVAVDYRTMQTHIGDASVAFMLGNEVEGVPEHILQLCDLVVEIPMVGMKESLNVSVAGGIILAHSVL